MYNEIAIHTRHAIDLAFTRGVINQNHVPKERAVMDEEATKVHTLHAKEGCKNIAVQYELFAQAAVRNQQALCCGWFDR